ncbi:MAG: hypothetical protein GY850_03305 [bacterium]|nr:hypothetical protein [bacterium]
MMVSKKRIGILLKISIGTMAFAALVWLSYEFYRLLRQPEYIGFYKVHPGAIDLKIFYRYVQRWAAGNPTPGGVYPPASYMMLWPLLGWMKIKSAIWFWAFTSTASLAFLVSITLKGSNAENRPERLFIAFIPLSMYATGAIIGNGQLTLHVFPLMITGVLLFNRQGTYLARDMAAAVMFILSLVKPTVAAPFFWIILFRPGRIRPAVLVVTGYLIISLIAVWQPWAPSPAKVSGQEKTGGNMIISLFEKKTAFLKTGINAASFAGESNIAIWLTKMGLKNWVFPASISMLLLLGFWIFHNRTADIWILLGVTAIVSRFWTYHRWYDDLLILLPIIALFRLIKSPVPTEPKRVLEGTLLGLALVLMLAPGGLYILPGFWKGIWTALQSIT